MEPPVITRHRRPFLAPLWGILLAALAIGAVAFALYRSATTTLVFLVQPVEKDPGTIADAPVSPEGEERAQRLAHMFGDSGGAGRVDAVYVSDDRRALQTGAPLIERLHGAPVVFSAADAGAAAARAVREHRGGAVLMIVTGPALAEVAHELAGAQLPAAARDDPDLICVVSIPTFGRAHLVRFRY
ncbi:MAG TPA: phosphoglycerate mutase family protein [Steroidobacteraceae bacterium]|nr:phosphoglycerate mutase family protein [Steroidobacteraceae bacterium]